MNIKLSNVFDREKNDEDLCKNDSDNFNSDNDDTPIDDFTNPNYFDMFPNLYINDKNEDD